MCIRETPTRFVRTHIWVGETSMKRIALFIAAALLVSMSAVAQGPDKVCEVNRVAAKPGAAKQLEAGRKAHNAWHAAQKDKDAILVWQFATGPQTGQYLMTTCGLTWAK